MESKPTLRLQCKKVLFLERCSKMQKEEFGLYVYVRMLFRKMSNVEGTTVSANLRWIIELKHTTM